MSWGLTPGHGSSRRGAVLAVTNAAKAGREYLPAMREIRCVRSTVLPVGFPREGDHRGGVMDRHRLSRLAATAIAAAVVVSGLAAGAGAFGAWAVVSSPNAGVYGSLLQGVNARTASDAWAVGATARSTS